MRRNWKFIVNVLCAGAAALAAGFLLHRAVGGGETVLARLDGGQGMVVSVDGSGKIAPAPASGVNLSAADRAAFSTSGAGLSEVAMSGSGYKLDLQGRFQSPLIVRVDGDGRVHVSHQHPFATDINR